MGSVISIQERPSLSEEVVSMQNIFSEIMQVPKESSGSSGELSVSFGYQCSANQDSSFLVNHNPVTSRGIEIESSIIRTSSSFSCLSGAALSANATLANTNICNGLIGEEILPGLDSPKLFRRMSSSPSLSRLDSLLSSSQSSMSTLGGSASEHDLLENGKNFVLPMSAPTKIESSSFLSAMDIQIAGGAAGEDRVQAVCSEESGWLFCGVYDGFNGRDAADYLAGTLYENVGFYLHMLEWHSKQEICGKNLTLSDEFMGSDKERKIFMLPRYVDGIFSSESFREGVIGCLCRALAQAESDFLYMVEQEMENRPDLVSVGSCVLVVLLHGNDLYILNLGDSRAVLAMCNSAEKKMMKAIQLTETHNVDNELEYQKILADHPDEPSVVVNGRVKGKLKLTRAFGVGYLKKSNLNDALMGILRVRNLCSPPYVYTHPFTMYHKVSESDLFVVLGSDGLFDFFTNDEVVNIVHCFILNNPFGDPAKHLIEQLVLRAADNAGFSAEELMQIPVGRRRKYHDDVSVVVIILGIKQRTSTASTTL